MVYSTCSIHEKENEEVIFKALQMNDEFVLEENILPVWPYRGFNSSILKCLYYITIFR